MPTLTPNHCVECIEQLDQLRTKRSGKSKPLYRLALLVALNKITYSFVSEYSIAITITSILNELICRNGI